MWFGSIHCFSYWIYGQKASNNNNNRRKTQSLARSHQNNTHKAILFGSIYSWHIQRNLCTNVYIYLFYLSFVPLDSKDSVCGVRVWVCVCMWVWENWCVCLCRCFWLENLFFPSHVTIAGWSLIFRMCIPCSMGLQLTLSLNNIKIMSNKSDTTNKRMDVYYVAIVI